MKRWRNRGMGEGEIDKREAKGRSQLQKFSLTQNAFRLLELTLELMSSVWNVI